LDKLSITFLDFYHLINQMKPSNKDNLNWIFLSARLTDRQAKEATLFLDGP